LPKHSDDGSHEFFDKGRGASGKKDAGNKNAGKTVRKTWLSMIPVLVVILMALLTGYAAHRFETLSSTVEALIDGLQKTGAGVETLQRQMTDTTQFSQNAQDTLAQLNSRVEKAVEQLETRKNRIEPVKKEKDQTDKSKVLNGIKVPDSDSKDSKDSKTGPAAPVNNPPEKITQEKITQVTNPCLKTYQATDTDTLWSISLDLYGSGKYYPVLMACNPNLDVFNLSGRHRIVHPCAKSRAADISRRIIGVKDNRWFWKYRVRAGDTPKSIARRFCSNQTDCFVDTPSFEPGTTIGIYLE
jgi:hypothetical protein